MDSFARELDINDFWDRQLSYILGVALGFIEPSFWRDINPLNFYVILIWHYREIWRLLRAKPSVRSSKEETR